MKKNEEKKKKIKNNVFIPPFLEGFNVKKIKTPINDINLEVMTTPALKLIEKVSFDDETTSETIIRIIENYLLLISLAKVYQMLFYDVQEHKTVPKMERLKKVLMRRFSGYNTSFLKELDEKIASEIFPSHYERMKRVSMKEEKQGKPIISNNLILPALENISYENVLSTMVERGIFPPEFIKNLTPKNEYGLLAVTIYRATMQLIEAELRLLIETERLKIPPESLNEFFSRLTKFATEMG